MNLAKIASFLKVSSILPFLFRPIFSRSFAPKIHLDHRGISIWATLQSQVENYHQVHSPLCGFDPGGTLHHSPFTTYPVLISSFCSRHLLQLSSINIEAGWEIPKAHMRPLLTHDWTPRTRRSSYYPMEAYTDFAAWNDEIEQCFKTGAKTEKRTWRTFCSTTTHFGVCERQPPELEGFDTRLFYIYIYI